MKPATRLWMTKAGSNAATDHMPAGLHLFLP